MVGWHHLLNGHESEKTLGDGEGQGSLACCSHGVSKSWTRLRKWQPTPVILPGEFHEQRSLAGYSPWGCRVRLTEQLSLTLILNSVLLKYHGE